LVTLGHFDNLHIDSGCFTLLEGEHVECPRLGIIGKSFRLEESLFRAGVVPGLVLSVSDSQSRIDTAPVVELLEHELEISITDCWSEMVHLYRQVVPEVVNWPRAIRNLGRKRICICRWFGNHLLDATHEQEQQEEDQETSTKTLTIDVSHVAHLLSRVGIRRAILLLRASTVGTQSIVTAYRSTALRSFPWELRPVFSEVDMPLW
jgi:hypothetical protein